MYLQEILYKLKGILELYLPLLAYITLYAALCKIKHHIECNIYIHVIKVISF